MDNTDYSALYNSKNSQPYVVYAVMSPTYPEEAFGCRDMISRLKEPYVFHGSTIIISGGCYEPDAETGELFIVGEGLPGSHETICKRLAERVIAGLVQPSDHFLIHYDKWPGKPQDWVDIARRQGLEVVETDKHIICTGSGKQLQALQWLEGATACSSEMLIVSDCKASHLEIEMLKTLRVGSDVNPLLTNFWDTLYKDPDIVQRELGDFRLFACLGDPDGANLAIHRRDINISHIDGILQTAAEDFGVALFDTGDLGVPNEEGYEKGVFASWCSWHPIPKNWRQVI